MIIEAIGWIATAVFALSYLFKSDSALRRIQAIAAVLWIVYGISIAAKPVIVANLIVAAFALGSTLTSRAAAPNQIRRARE
jgi:uncharacterized protein with PQ loop repeat